MCGVRLPVQVSRSSPRWRLLRLPRRSGTPTDALFDCVSPPRASQLRLTHCLSVSTAALVLPPTRSVSRDGARCLPTLPVCLCCRPTRDHGAHPPTSASPARDRTSQKLGAPADCVLRALCMCNPFRGRLVAAPPRHASPLQRPRTPRTPRPQPCLSCVRAPQLRVPILFSGLDVASVQAARSSRLLKPSAQATSHSLNLKPPARPRAARSRRSIKTLVQLDHAARSRDAARSRRSSSRSLNPPLSHTSCSLKPLALRDAHTRSAAGCSAARPPNRARTALT